MHAWERIGITLQVKIQPRRWEQLPKRWPHIESGAFQVMRNHFHGIVIDAAPVSAAAAAQEAVSEVKKLRQPFL